MGMQWYIIHTYSGFEKKVKESLESRVAAFSLQDKIGRVLIPMEEVVEVRGGKKVVSSRMSYPGYVLVEMDLDENTWHIVRSTPRVTGFVGSATSPSPLSEAEVDGIINRVHTPQDRPKPKVIFERNEQVRIVDRKTGISRARREIEKRLRQDMAKKIQTTIKLQLPAGKATPAPPVGTALGPHGLNIMDFCKQFNAKTAKEPDGMIFPVLVTVYTDRTFTFILKTPPASVLLKRAANIAKGSAEPNRNKVGKVTRKQVEEIAKIKLVDLNTTNLESAMRTVMGTARNMGLEVVEA